MSFSSLISFKTLILAMELIFFLQKQFSLLSLFDFETPSFRNALKVFLRRIGKVLILRIGVEKLYWNWYAWRNYVHPWQFRKEVGIEIDNDDWKFLYLIQKSL